MLARLALVAMVLALSACADAPTPADPPTAATTAGPRALTTDGPYRHPASGMRFPAAVGTFARTALTQYDRDGLIVSAGYRADTPAALVTATVYVYPPRPAPGGHDAVCRDEFAARAADVLRANPGATLIEAHDELLRQGGAAHAGRQATFTYRMTFGGAPTAVSSELHLFCFVAGRWQVQYRFTYPEGAPAAPVVAGFLQELTWTIGGTLAEGLSLDRLTEPAG